MNEELYVTTAAGEAALLERVLKHEGIGCHVEERAMWRGTPFWVVFVACADLPRGRELRDSIHWETAQ